MHWRLKNKYKIPARKPEAKTSLGRPRWIREECIREIRHNDTEWIHVVQEWY